MVLAESNIFSQKTSVEKRTWDHIRLKQLRYVVSGDYFLQHTVFHTKSAGPLRRRDSDHDFSAVDCRNSHHGDLRMFIFLHNERLWERQQPSGVVLGWVLIQSALLTKCMALTHASEAREEAQPCMFQCSGWEAKSSVQWRLTWRRMFMHLSFLHLVRLLYECLQKSTLSQRRRMNISGKELVISGSISLSKKSTYVYRVRIKSLLYIWTVDQTWPLYT